MYILYNGKMCVCAHTCAMCMFHLDPSYFQVLLSCWLTVATFFPTHLCKCVSLCRLVWGMNMYLSTGQTEVHFFIIYLFIFIIIYIVLAALHIDETGCTLESLQLCNKTKANALFSKVASTCPWHLVHTRACVLFVCLFVCLSQTNVPFFLPPFVHTQTDF